MYLLTVGEITSINLESGDKATYYYYNGLNALTKLLLQIIYCFNERSSITFNNNTYNFNGLTSNNKVDFIMSGHTHSDFLAYHTYEPITLTNDTYTISESNIVNNVAFITDSTGSTLRGSYSIDYNTGIITNLGGLQDGDIVHYDYGVPSETPANSTDIPVVLTMQLSMNNANIASFDLVFVDYDDNVIKTIRVGTGSDRQINIGVDNNG